VILVALLYMTSHESDGGLDLRRSQIGTMSVETSVRVSMVPNEQA
jgi:hypothetical protein